MTVTSLRHLVDSGIEDQLLRKGKYHCVSSLTDFNFISLLQTNNLIFLFDTVKLSTYSIKLYGSINYGFIVMAKFWL